MEKNRNLAKMLFTHAFLLDGKKLAFIGGGWNDAVITKGYCSGKKTW